MHINNCNTGEVEIVMLHHIKNIQVAIKPFRILKRLKFWGLSSALSPLRLSAAVERHFFESQSKRTAPAE